MTFGGYMSLVMFWVFAHLPTIGYFEPEISALDDLITNRWKPTRGIGQAYLIREKLVTSRWMLLLVSGLFLNKPFSLASSGMRQTCGFIF
ncbi:hypothetical protein JHK82_034067 [Glycine max]|uniref:Uncharacterized protein n=1 Tax=Glycine max TaxID=3847 RepID=A0A0R0HIQ3_SOYBN|nr:hypothetical protein JHK87_033995 [Glycine soja]KAG4980817.1 hypothetical protein JHK85_034775 [Glycine max]KAG4986446.1 hypothetical protein JHK86_034137 [Glycine max]KAG5119647.1 hypothetical protein JHK82_034067 [Glycine max]KAG5140632.1 hypothetical protein JHK84_034400 [Glycine max]